MHHYRKSQHHNRGSDNPKQVLHRNQAESGFVVDRMDKHTLARVRIQTKSPGPLSLKHNEPTLKCPIGHQLPHISVAADRMPGMSTARGQTEKDNAPCSHVWHHTHKH